MERLNKVNARIVIGEDEKGSVELQMGEAWLPATDVLPLSAALSESVGIAFLGTSTAHYITDVSPDILFLLTKVVESLNKVVDICEASYIISADNAISGQNSSLQPIKTELETLIQELEEYKLR